MSKHSITAVFDTRAHAEQAMAQLKSSGISASDITLLPASSEAVSSTETGQGFWASLEQLFGGTPDHATYAESIRRGGIMLSVRAEDDRLDDVVDILEQHGSVDLDEREANWRSSGWIRAAWSAASAHPSRSAGGLFPAAAAGHIVDVQVSAALLLAVLVGGLCGWIWPEALAGLLGSFCMSVAAARLLVRSGATLVDARPEGQFG